MGWARAADSVYYVRFMVSSGIVSQEKMVRIAPEHSHKPRERRAKPKPKKTPRLKHSNALRDLFKSPSRRKIAPKDVKVGRAESPRAKKHRKESLERVEAAESRKKNLKRRDIVEDMKTPVRKAVDKLKTLLK